MIVHGRIWKNMQEKYLTYYTDRNISPIGRKGGLPSCHLWAGYSDPNRNIIMTQKIHNFKIPEDEMLASFSKRVFMHSKS
jgi:hypothetical protein